MGKNYFVVIEDGVYYDKDQDKVVLTQPVTQEDVMNSLLGIEEIDGIQQEIISAIDPYEYMENSGNIINITKLRKSSNHS